MPDDRIIHVGGSPYDMGFEHGKACREQIEYAVRKALLQEINKRNQYTFEDAVARAKPYMDLGRKFAPHLDEELHGIADGAELSYEEICLLQVRSELSYPESLSAAAECSTVAIQSHRTRNGETLVGANVDMGEQLESLGVVLHLEPKHGPRILTWTLAGVVGQTGLNSAGLARCGNVLFALGWRTGVPTTFLFRCLLEQETLQEAVVLCSSAKRAKSNNILLADSGDQVVDIEMTVDGERLLFPMNGVLFHTNHYVHPELEKFDRYTEQEDSRQRRARLGELLASEELFDEASLGQLLSDHANPPHTICKHADGNKQAIKTVASCVMTPALGRMCVSFGNPCSNERMILSV
jgi:isopenicillin-N N-acyltransferase-like protein